ncbi:ABC transporter permease [Erythrobacter sp. NE805]|uniref:ABC transporter permease n=1 Tax=Erythrobacter sp. NE805 TaxID=3389875 RepID=UPI00396B47A3
MMWTAVAMALEALRRHLLRSVLTVLGLVIGVWSVVTMVTLGNATTVAITASISALGSDTLTLMPGQTVRGGGAGGRPFSLDDVAAIAAEIAGVRLAVPQVTTQRTVVANASDWKTSVTGTTGAYLDVQQWPVTAGRRFTAEEEDSGSAVCLLGDTVRQRLFGDLAFVGGLIRVGKVSCTIVGGLKPRGQGFGNNPDDSVLMPIGAVQRRLTGSRDVSTIVVAYDNRYDPERIKEDLRRLMRDRRYIDAGTDDDFSIFDARQIADTVSSTTAMLTALLAAVAAVSLIVGGIGIMNIMLVSVTERTREIGIRLAVGATARDVLVQFLIEAVVLSAFGGLVGLALATATTALVAPLMGVTFAFDPFISILAVALSGSVGILFGYVPAKRAAALDPIQALRHE